MQRIILADDHQLLLEGIKTIINEIERIQVVAEINNGSDLLTFLSKDTVDLVVLDLNIPGQDGIKCLTIIKERYPATKVLVLTSYAQPDLISQVKKLNAEGYLNKNSSSSELKEAIVQVLKGGQHYPKEREQELNRSSYFADDFLKKYQLTKREVDIIRLICSEMSSKQIAAELYLSEFTINTHRKNIFRKLDIKNVAGLMNFAKENGLI